MTRNQSPSYSSVHNLLKLALQGIRAADLTDEQADGYWAKAWQCLDLPTRHDQALAFTRLLEELRHIRACPVEEA